MRVEREYLVGILKFRFPSTRFRHIDDNLAALDYALRQFDIENIKLYSLYVSGKYSAQQCVQCVGFNDVKYVWELFGHIQLVLSNPHWVKFVRTGLKRYTEYFNNEMAKPIEKRTFCVDDLDASGEVISSLRSRGYNDLHQVVSVLRYSKYNTKKVGIYNRGRASFFKALVDIGYKDTIFYTYAKNYPHSIDIVLSVQDDELFYGDGDVATRAIFTALNEVNDFDNILYNLYFIVQLNESEISKVIGISREAVLKKLANVIRTVKPIIRTYMSREGLKDSNSEVSDELLIYKKFLEYCEKVNVKDYYLALSTYYKEYGLDNDTLLRFRLNEESELIIFTTESELLERRVLS